jgi:hypothetical protein
MPLDFDIKKIDYMLKEPCKILDNVKQNEGRLRMDYSVSFYNNMTDSYNELLKIRKFLQMDSK